MVNKLEGQRKFTLKCLEKEVHRKHPILSTDSPKGKEIGGTGYLWRWGIKQGKKRDISYPVAHLPWNRQKSSQTGCSESNGGNTGKNLSRPPPGTPAILSWGQRSAQGEKRHTDTKAWISKTSIHIKLSIYPSGRQSFSQLFNASLLNMTLYLFDKSL